MSEVTMVIISAAKNADQKPVTSNFSLHRAVSESIAALIIKIKRPKVMIDTGKVRILIIDPKIALMRPKRSATHRYVPTPPSTVIPGTTRVATHIESASATQRSNKPMY
jgi:hypothetical protein